MGTRCTDHVTPLSPQKLALTSPTGGGRSVGIVRVRAKATEFSFSVQYRDLQEYVVPKMQINLSTFSGLRIFYFWNMNFIS